MTVRSLQLRSLENRLTPAAAFTSALVGTTLTLTGTDEAEAITIRDDGAGVTIFGLGGTQIDGVAFKTFPGTVNSIKVIAKGGDDSVAFDNTNPIALPGTLDFDMGAASAFGGNAVFLDATVTVNLGNVKIKGGEGFDYVSISGTLTFTIAQNVTTDYGPGGSFTQLLAGTTVQGGIDVKAGLGGDTLNLNNVNVTKDVKFTVGDGSSTSNINGSTINGSVLYKGGALDDTLNLGTTTIKGVKGIDVQGGKGTVTLTTNTGPVNLTAGGIKIKSTDAPTTVFVNPGANLTTPGDFTMDGSNVNLQLNADLAARNLTLSGATGVNLTSGVGTTALTLSKNLTLNSTMLNNADVNINNGTLSVGGNLSVTGPSANVILTSTNNATITGNVNLNAKVGPATFFQTGAGFSIGGNLAVKGNTGVTANLVPTTPSTITGSVTAQSKYGNALFLHQGAGNLNIGAKLTVKASDVAQLITFATATTTINGAVSLTASPTTGFTQAIFQSTNVVLADTLSVGSANLFALFAPTAAGSVAKNTTFNAGTTNMFVVANNTMAFNKDVIFTNKNCVSNINLVGTTIGGNLSITTGNEVDNITLNGVNVAGTTTIKTGGGGDTVTIGNVAVFTGVTTIDTGAGDDTLNIAQNVGLGANAATFTGKATIKSGAGNDTLALGVSLGSGGDGFSLATFGAGSSIDGGTNFNLFDDETGQFTGAPTITGWTDPTP